MSTLADVQALYGSVRSTWTKSQAHVVSHLVLGFVLFGVFRVTLPDFEIPHVTATQIADNEWFKLAKDTGVIYVSLVVPFILVGVYGELLRTAGQWLIGVLVMLFQPGARQNRYRLLNEWTLEPLALLLRKNDFEISDLITKSGELAMKYQSKKNEQWESYQRSLNDLTKNSTIYLGDFLSFLAVWILFFRAFPHLAWVQTNRPHLWSVALALLALAWFAWFRVSHALKVVPSLTVMFIAAMIRADPDMAGLLESHTEEERVAVRSRLRELLGAEKRYSQPSLYRFICSRLGMELKSEDQKDPGGRKDRSGWPFISVYRKGLDFSYDEKQHAENHPGWIEGYFAYLYYRTWQRLYMLGKTVLNVIRYLVTGTP